MRTHNIRFNDEIRNFPKIALNICFLELSEEFPRASNTSLNKPTLKSHHVWGTDVLLYV